MLPACFGIARRVPHETHLITKVSPVGSTTGSSGFGSVAGLGSAEDTNKRFHHLVQQGQTGLSVAFDMPTLMGYDSDAPTARGECGKCGVAIDTLKDVEDLFDGLPIDRITTSMTINPPASVLWAMYIAMAEKRGISRGIIGGTIQNDMLKEFIAQKTFMCPPRPSMRLITDTIEFGTKEVPRWNPVSISGYHIREAGSTAVQELAFTLADGIAYVEAVLERGLDVDSFAQRLSFFFNSHLDFFEEIAKFRAARRMWARIMKERFKAKDPRSMWLRFHTQTAGCSLTAQQPYNNVIRTTLEALAAVLGGTQSLHTNSFDEAVGLPTDFSARISRNTQILIQEESQICHVADPLGGSYYVEALTDGIITEARKIIDEVEKLAIDRAKELFHAEHANVQPHSGSQANMAAYFSLLEYGDTVMAMDLAHGGHLTHGAPVTFSGKSYNFISYGVNRETERIDYPEVERLVYFWNSQKEQAAAPIRIEEVAPPPTMGGRGGQQEDPLMDSARELMEQHDNISTSFLQRKLHIGYPRAARLMDLLEEQGVVAAGEPGKSRQVLGGKGG